MFNWKHWRLTIDGTATEFDLSDEELTALDDYVGVPLAVMHDAMRRWNDAGTAERPHGWSHDEDGHAIEAWAANPEKPGELVAFTLFTDQLEGVGVVYDLSFFTALERTDPVQFRLEPYFPELEKQSSVIEQANAISAFLDGLPDDVGLVRFTDQNGDDDLVEHLHRGAVEELLAEHFEIDLKQVEVERRALLGYLAQLNERN